MVFKKYLIWVGSFLCLSCSFSVPKEEPNLVFILTDDQVFRAIGALNQYEKIHTPNLDRLLKSSKSFTQMHNMGSFSAAVCMPSRAMINSGQTLWKVQNGIGKLPLWGESFRANNYTTFATGKWHNGYPALHKSFEFLGTDNGGLMLSSSGGKQRYFKMRGMLKTHYDKNGIHSSNTIVNSSIKFLREKAQKDNPFFMYVAFFAPHDPRESDEKYRNRYPVDDIQVPPNFLPIHPFETGGRKIRTEVLIPYPRTKEAIRIHRSHYYAIITHMDEQIGRLLTELEKRDDYDNTYIIFTSDHGLDLGEHGAVGKQSLYDSATHVPFFIAGPGVKKGSSDDSDLQLYQLFSTTAELCGITLDSKVPNTSFAGLVVENKGLTTYVPQYSYGAFKKYTIDYSRMVKDSEYKLILYPFAKKIQLFDRKNDLWELKNLATQESMEPIIRKLYYQLIKLQKELDDKLKLPSIDSILASWGRPDFTEKGNAKKLKKWISDFNKKKSTVSKKGERESLLDGTYFKR